MSFQVLIVTTSRDSRAKGDDTSGVSTFIARFDSPVLAEAAYQQVLDANRTCDTASFEAVKLYVEEEL